MIVSAQPRGSGSAEFLLIPKDGNDGKGAIFMTKVSGTVISQYVVRYENNVGELKEQVLGVTDMTEEGKKYAVEAVFPFSQQTMS